MLNENTFNGDLSAAGAGRMTVNGAIQKSVILFALLVGAGLFTFRFPGSVGMPVIIGAFVATAVICLVLYFKPQWSPVLAPTYAVLDGVVMGAISLMYAKAFDGLVVQALLLTLGTLAGMLGLYSFGIVRPTQKFRAIVGAATLGIAIFYLVAIVLAMFGIKIPMIHQGGMIGIGFSLFVVTIAALNLIIDFGNIEEGAEAGAPKFMEWYCGFALLVTIVWLYLEILRLLAKLRSND